MIKEQAQETLSNTTRKNRRDQRSSICRFCSGHGQSMGRPKRFGMDGKKHKPDYPKSWVFFFIAEMILDLELEYDTPVTDHCGTCTACIDACPTEALTPYNIDASKCISYLTIELKDQIPAKFQNKMDDWAFGCDVCQDVCPWNRFSISHNETLFDPKPEILDFNEKTGKNSPRPPLSPYLKTARQKN